MPVKLVKGNPSTLDKKKRTVKKKKEKLKTKKRKKPSKIRRPPSTEGILKSFGHPGVSTNRARRHNLPVLLNVSGHKHIPIQKLSIKGLLRHIITHSQLGRRNKKKRLIGRRQANIFIEEPGEHNEKILVLNPLAF